MRAPRERLRDILEAIAKIQRYTARGREALEQDELLQVWVLYHIQLIGLSGKRRPGLARRFTRPTATSRGLRSSLCATSSCMNTSAWTGNKSGERWSKTSPA